MDSNKKEMQYAIMQATNKGMGPEEGESRERERNE